MAFPATARPGVLALRTSQIREVANAGFGQEDVLPFWFGESDLPTPQFIRDAAAAAVVQGQTFYTHNLGRADLRQALSSYLTRLHKRSIDFDRLAICNSGVNALMLCAQAVISPGDRVVVVAPVWPNLVEIPRVLSASVETVALEARDGKWRLDLDRLFRTLTSDTKALFINSPNNPTGWTLPAGDRAAILARCRQYGIWLIGDDVYERLHYESAASAPSFLELVHDEDRFISTNSFSKAWRMTGWRLGWLVAPPALIPSLGVLLEYNTSCPPDFMQTAAITALEKGEPSVTALRSEMMQARDQVRTGLSQTDGIDAPEPEGGMYCFFRLDGCTDSVAVAKDLIETVGLGLAPARRLGPRAPAGSTGATRRGRKRTRKA